MLITKATIKKLFTLSQKACNANSSKYDYILGCSNLAWLYANGHYVKQNYKKAAQFYTKACESGDMFSCNSLGALYQEGFGVKQDLQKAVKLFEKSCKWFKIKHFDGTMQNGSGLNSCINLGSIITENASIDFGVLFADAFENNKDLYKKLYDKPPRERNPIMASIEYSMLCDKLNYANACLSEGYLRFQTNASLAFKYFNKACDKGLASGCDIVGAFFKEGYQVVQKDYKIAKEYFNKACNMGYKRSCKELKRLTQ